MVVLARTYQWLECIDCGRYSTACDGETNDKTPVNSIPHQAQQGQAGLASACTVSRWGGLGGGGAGTVLFSSSSGIIDQALGGRGRCLLRVGERERDEGGAGVEGHVWARVLAGKCGRTVVGSVGGWATGNACDKWWSRATSCSSRHVHCVAT